MFGFDKMFDFNRNGKLDSWERAAQFQFMDEMMKDNKETRKAIKYGKLFMTIYYM